MVVKIKNRVKAEHYFTKKPTSRFKEYYFDDVIRGFDLHFKSGSGVFSAKKVDSGSRLLAEFMEIPPGSCILDLGCGYGILGIVAAKLDYGNKVYMTDVNNRACKLSKDNLELNNVKAKVKQGNMFDAFPGKKFDVILFNPPQTAGKILCINMIRQSVNYLKPGGSLQMVVRHKKGGESLFNEMKNVFKLTRVLAKKGGYRVYYGEK